MEEIKVKIELNEVPHFTTLQKFSQRINSLIFNRLLNRLIKLFYDWGERVTCTDYRFNRVYQFIHEPLLFMENRKNTKKIHKNLCFR